MTPSRLGPFSILSKIGAGGMGMVYRAEHDDGRHVALKVIRPRGDPEHVEMLGSRLLREARALARVKHPGVVELVDWGRHEDTIFIAMAHVEGVNLRTLQGRMAAPKVAAGVGSQLADALAAIHDAGIVHRDVKLSNVLIDEQLRVVLIDFGLASVDGATVITKAGQLLGSPGYVAPEIFNGGPASEASDQFALGKLIFSLCASPPAPLPKGTPVLARFSMRMGVDWNRFPKEEMWQPLARVVMRMIEPDPERRFPTMEKCRDALAEASGQRPSTDDLTIDIAVDLSQMIDAISDRIEPTSLRQGAVKKPRFRSPLLAILPIGVLAGLLSGLLAVEILRPGPPDIAVPTPSAQLDREIGEGARVAALDALREGRFDAAVRSLQSCIEYANLKACRRDLAVAAALTGRTVED